MKQCGILLLSLLLCQWVSGCQLLQGSRIVRGEDYQGALFAKGQVNKLYVGETDFWTPTADDVKTLEAGLEAFLRERADPRLDQKVLLTLREYNRQYVGIMENEHRKVYVLFYCNFPLEQLRDGVIIVNDGGDCFFQLKYDVDAQKFDELTVNGLA
jgi:hypothetical protein